MSHSGNLSEPQGRLFGTISAFSDLDAGTCTDFLTDLKSELNLELQISKLELIASLVPGRIIERHIRSQAKLEVFSETFQTAVLFADISGFSALAERLVKEINHVAYAAENLSQYIGASLEQMVASICTSGGDVIKFAGDAILAIFPAEAFDNDLDVATLRCSQVALELSSYAFKVGNTRGAINLSVHCGVGCGDVVCYHVGGYSNRWEYVVTGPPIEQIGRAEPEASPGETVLSQEAAEVLGTFAEGERLKSNNLLLKSVNIPKSLERNHIPRGLILSKLEKFMSEDLSQYRRMHNLLRCYVPPPALISIDSGNGIWSGELRVCTTVFCQVQGLRYASSDVAVIQNAFYIIQKHVDDYGGTLLRFIVDDKGAGVLMGFGLPPQKHENDGIRAVKASLDIIAELSRHDIGCSIGITTGEVFCGTVGGQLRAEYTLHGVKVNLAARLMVAAKTNILCDRQTYNDSKEFISFATEYRIKVKGKSGEVTVFPALKMKLVVSFDSSRVKPIGRSEGQSLVKKLLREVLEGESRNLLISGDAGMGKTMMCRYASQKCTSRDFVVLSARGDDTEKLTPFFLWKTLTIQMLNCFDTTGLGVLQLTEAQFLRKLIDRIPGDSFPKTSKTSVTSVDFQMTEDDEEDNDKPKMENIAGILSHLVPDLGLERGPKLNPLTTESAFNSLTRIIVDIFIAAAEELRCGSLEKDRVHMIVIVEDLQWSDDLSAEVIYRLMKEKCPIGIIVTCRESMMQQDNESLISNAGNPHNAGQVVASWYREMISMSATCSLKALKQEDIKQCIARWVGATRVPSRLSNIIYKKSQGHPFFAEELCKLMIEDKQIILKGEVCKLANENEDDDLGLPNSISALMTSRLDRIPPSQQLTLKVAAVIGSEFRVHMLASLLLRYSGSDLDEQSSSHAKTARALQHEHRPVAVAGDLREISKLLQENISALVARGFLVIDRDVSTQDHIVRFSNVMLRESAYNLLLFKMRKELHRNVAELLEERNEEYLQPVYYALSKHFYCAELFDNTLYYLEVAGNDALEVHSMQRVWICFTRLVHLDTLRRLQHIADHRRASWYRKIAESNMYFGHAENAEQNLRKALYVLNLNLSSSPDKIKERQKSIFGHFRRSLKRDTGSNKSLNKHNNQESIKPGYVEEVLATFHMPVNRGTYQTKFIYSHSDSTKVDVNPAKRERAATSIQTNGFRALFTRRKENHPSDKACNVQETMQNYNRIELTRGYEAILKDASTSVEKFLEASRITDLLGSLIFDQFSNTGLERRLNALTLAKAAKSSSDSRRIQNGTEAVATRSLVVDLDDHRMHEMKQVDSAAAALDQLAMCHVSCALLYLRMGKPWALEISTEHIQKVEELIDRITGTEVKGRVTLMLGEYHLLLGDYKQADTLFRKATWVFNFLELTKRKCEALELHVTCEYLSGRSFKTVEALGSMLYQEGQGFPVVIGLYALLLLRNARYRQGYLTLERSLGAQLGFLNETADSVVENVLVILTAKHGPNIGPAAFLGFAVLLSRRYGYKELALHAGMAAIDAAINPTLEHLPITEFPLLFAIFQLYFESYSGFVDTDPNCSEKSFSNRKLSILSHGQDTLMRHQSSFSSMDEMSQRQLVIVEESKPCLHHTPPRVEVNQADLKMERRKAFDKLEILFRYVERYGIAYPDSCSAYVPYCQAVLALVKGHRLSSSKVKVLLEKAASKAHQMKLFNLKYVTMLEIAVIRKDMKILNQLQVWFKEMDAKFYLRRTLYETKQIR